MVFGFFLVSGALAYFTYKRIKEPFLFLLLAVVYSIVIFMPTLAWTYLFDDIDNFYTITTLHNGFDAVNYILTPGYGHFIPLIRALYLFCFKYFWLNPAFFHALIILALILSGILLSGVLWELTASKIAAVFGGVLILWSTSYLDCMETAFAHTLFCLPVVLLALYGLCRYVKTNRRRWIVVSAAASFLAPCISAVGVLTGIWVLLFFTLCLPANTKKDLQKRPAILFPVLGSWCLSAGIFFVVVNPVHIILQEGNHQAIFDFPYFVGIGWLVFKSIILYSVPLVTSFEKLSLFIVIFLVLILIIKWQQSPKGALLFFFLWLIGNYMFVYYGRGSYGEMIVSTQRYHFYPSLGLAAICAVIMSVILKDRSLANLKIKTAVSILLFLLVALYATAQHNNVLKASCGKKDFFAIGLEFRKVVGDYLAKTHQDKVTIKNQEISLEYYDFLRKEFKQYAAIFLFPSDFDKITWGDRTDNAFIAFIKSNESQYPKIKQILLVNGYL